MTAPTTRETADHAELAAELRAFEGSDDLGNGDFTVCEFAADALENLLSEIAALRGERDRLRNAASKSNEEVCQSLGKALGYPWFKDDQANFHGSTETDGVCVGDHVAESIADEAARRLTQAERQRDELRKALVAICLEASRPGMKPQHLLRVIAVATTPVRALLANQGPDQ